jgi:hypothetical protein
MTEKSGANAENDPDRFVERVEIFEASLARVSVALACDHLLCARWGSLAIDDGR